MKYQKGNYRRGGIGLLLGTLIALILAVAFKAPWMALASIGIFGFGGGIVSILVGDRRPL
ncbi:MAG TPA: hypothetical protein ENH29_00015 [Bacteroidetes bacterium]|nr:hypothetical protein [Bacteroidota bacterium]